MEREVAEILLGMKAVTLRTDPPYKWVSGIHSPIYTDNRVLLSFPAERRSILKCMLSVVKEIGEPDVIAGVATSGIPWAAWVAEAMGKPMIYVRSKKKEHGQENVIEGRLKPGQRVLVIEDLVSTGGSSVAAVENVRHAGGLVDDCLAIFTYELEKAKHNFSAAKCRLSALTRFGTLIQVASEMGYLRKEEKDKVLDWSKDPEGWGKKLGLE